jgi:hypothetical protein
MNPTSPAKLFWLVLLLVFWAFYGLTGRDAWKSEEAVALTPILDWLDGLTSVWSTPAPLYTLAAGIAIKLNLAGGDIQDGARLASGLFTCIALLFTGLSARALYGPGYGQTAAIALVGGFGLMLSAHALLPETALLAAWSVLLYGVTTARNGTASSQAAIGLGLTLSTLGLRGLPDLLAGVLIVLLPMLSPSWRGWQYRQSILRGWLLAVGLISITVIYLWASGNLSGWLRWHGLSGFNSLRPHANAYSELPWFAWPLWPLAFGAIWHAHRRLGRAPELHFALIALAILLAAALVPAWSRNGALISVLLPLALLATYGLDNLQRGAAQAMYWFGVLFFAFLALAFWIYFAAIEWGYPTKLALRLARLTPSYRPGSVETISYVLAVAATLLWIIAIPLFPRAKNRPLLVWATGMILIWVLLTALFRPWIEAGWAYRPLIADLSRHLPADACLNAQVDPAMRTMLRLHRKAPQRAACAWTLKLVDRGGGKPDAVAKGAVIWQGSRPRYKSQVYRLERHEPAQSTTPP